VNTILETARCLRTILKIFTATNVPTHAWHVLVEGHRIEFLVGIPALFLLRETENLPHSKTTTRMMGLPQAIVKSFVIRLVLLEFALDVAFR
jgi:hypothetical protein